MLDSELAALYGVTTGRLNEQIKRNADRFPANFLFRLSTAEWGHLKSQFAISSGHGSSRKLPLAFTEHGAIMTANVLNLARAVKANIYVMRAFVNLRQMLSTQKELAGQAGGARTASREARWRTDLTRRRDPATDGTSARSSAEANRVPHGSGKATCGEPATRSRV